MATFEEVVQTNGAVLGTPTHRSNGRYAYGTLRGGDYTYHTPRNDPQEQAEMHNYAHCFFNVIALDINIPLLNPLLSSILVEVNRVTSVAPQTSMEVSTLVENNNTIAIPLKPLLLRVKNDKTNSSQGSQYNVITCKYGNTDYYIAKDIEFDVIKYIDLRKHTTDNYNISLNFDELSDARLLSIDTTDKVGEALPDTSASEQYDDIITTYLGITIKFDYLVFKKYNNTAGLSGIHVVSAFNMQYNIGLGYQSHEGRIGTFKFESIASKLSQVNELLYRGMPGAIIAHTDKTSRDGLSPVGNDYLNLGDITCSVSRTNYCEYTTNHKYWPGGKLVNTDSIEDAIHQELPIVRNRDNKGVIYNCTLSLLLSFGYKDEYSTHTGFTGTYIDSSLKLDLYHNDLISTDYMSKNGTLHDDYLMFMTRGDFAVDGTDFIDVTPEIIIANIAEYQFDPTTLIDIIFTKRNSARHFQFQKTTKDSGEIKHTKEDYYGDIIEDAFAYIDSNPGVQFTDNTPFITPMEFYARGKTDFEFDDKVTNIVETEDEPTYFWIETLKNWGYFTINGKYSSEANIVVDLLLWDGAGHWVDAAPIFDNIKKTFIPKERFQYYIDRIKALKPTKDSQPPAASQAEYDKLNEEINTMMAVVAARNTTLPFKFENVTTVDIERAYHNSTANYAGQSSSHWWDYIPIVWAAKATWSGLKAAWNFSPAGMFYNTFWGDGFIEGIKTGYKDLFECVYDLYGGELVALISLGVSLLFGDEVDDSVAKRDPYQHLMAICRYIVLNYDESYSNNDSKTLQTIRPDLVRYTDLEGGIINRETIVEYSVIPNVIGSPFVTRSSTGELMLAYRMCYSGPVKEDADSTHDLIKRSGIIEKDVEFSNKLLQDKLGKGEFKTALDMFNTYGNIPTNDVKSTTSTKLPETTETAGVDRLNNRVQTAIGVITLKTNRSKTSSDLDSAEINTLTKW